MGEFHAIFAASIVSMLGNVVAAVALTVLVCERTHSPALAASVRALAFLPYLIGAPGYGRTPGVVPAAAVRRPSLMLAALATNSYDAVRYPARTGT